MSASVTYIKLEEEQLKNLIEQAASIGIQAYIKEKNKKEMLTTGDCAKEYNCSILTIKRYIRSGKLIASIVKKNYRISRYEFNKFIEKHRTA